MMNIRYFKYDATKNHIFVALVVCFCWLFIPATQASMPRGLYVCYDGRSISVTHWGYVWDATRGCFKSNFPCQMYFSRFYGSYKNRAFQELGYQTCRQGYPYRLGEF